MSLAAYASETNKLYFGATLARHLIQMAHRVEPKLSLTDSVELNAFAAPN